MKTAFMNAGAVFTGVLESPAVEADSVLIADGIIEQVGRQAACDLTSLDEVWDLAGMTIIPGLIDSHAHPAIGDWTPRQPAIGWMENALHGGVTTMISMGEARIDGEPRGAAALKALAIAAAGLYSRFRPGGLKVKAGAVWPVPGLTDRDLEEMAACAVFALAEVGAMELPPEDELRDLVASAHRHGLMVPVHAGSRRQPGTKRMDPDFIAQLRPHVLCHLNGGPIPPPWPEVVALLASTDSHIEISYGGSPRAARDLALLAAEDGQLHRVILGSDTPASIGTVPIAISRLMSLLGAFTDIGIGEIIAMATGNTARAYGLNSGVIERGRAADLLVLDTPVGSWGSDPVDAIRHGENISISAIVVDGRVVTARPRNTQPATRVILRVD